VARPKEKEANKGRDPTPSQRSQAIRDLNDAIRLEPSDNTQKADDHAERGRLLFASGETAQALAAYDAALKIVPGNLKALRLRTLALLELQRYDDVLAASDAFLTRGKPSADLLEIRGQARLARKDFGGAISDYTVAMSLTPDSAALHNRRGWAYLFSDAFKLALADFDSAVRLEPGLGHAYSGRGLALVSLGRWRDAVADVETAVRLSTSDLRQQAYYNAARVHALSLKFAADDVSRHGEAGLALHRRLRERASALLVQSVHQLPTEKRASFLRDVVATDPVLRPFIPN
jgi:eukaryotic-like serine/threonine-protein kinase